MFARRRRAAIRKRTDFMEEARWMEGEVRTRSMSLSKVNRNGVL